MSRSKIAVIAALGAATVLLAGCEPAAVDTVQRGYRGTGIQQAYNPSTQAVVAAANQAPASQPPASPDGPRAAEVYQNVKVLGDLSIGEFTRVMASITEWVVPKDLPAEEGGCNYCHAGANFAGDEKYPKVVARRMLEMTRHINTDWKQHVAATGVTCYTCHRGNAVPANVWFSPEEKSHRAGFVASNAMQNTVSVGTTSLPYDALDAFLLDAKPIRVASGAALPDGSNRSSIKQTEWTYGLMVHMSEGLGVNCTYCHNSRAFANWEQSSPTRVTAWYGIRMARDLNVAYMTPLTSTFPAHRLGPKGDVAKVNCATCHNGVYKPLYGVSMAKDYPELVSARPPPAPPADAAAAEGAAPADAAAAGATAP